MNKYLFLIYAFFAAAILGGFTYNANADVQPLFKKTVSAFNLSTPTLCAEEDNVNIPVIGNVRYFVIRATHPTYVLGMDSCKENFDNCPGGAVGYPSTLPPTPKSDSEPCKIPPENERLCKIFDDHETYIKVVREKEWWFPTDGMTVSVDNGIPVPDIHYIQVGRKIADVAEWPEFFVLYVDGNIRLIPHPPEKITKVCYGSSVIVGPAPTASRPFAEIASVNYNSRFKTLDVTYVSGGTASLDLKHVTREKARVGVSINYATTVPFATFRSMFVQEGNADVDYVKWSDLSGIYNDIPIMTLPETESGGWFFYRQLRSVHNTSAPDIEIRVDIPRLDTMVIDFDQYGIWLHQSDGSWSKLHDLAAVQIVVTELDDNGKTDLAVNFGNPYGIWLWMNNQNWVKLHDLSPISITTTDLDDNGKTDLAVNFGDTYGIWFWMNNQNWVKLHDLSPASITTADLDGNDKADLVVNFGNPYGIWLWMNNQNWVKLHDLSPASIATADLDGNGKADLAVNFGRPYGTWLWINNQNWVKLHDLSPVSITTADMDGNGKADLAVNFGGPYGTWLWMNSQDWVKLHSLSPASVTAAYLDDNTQQDLTIDFAPYGIWMWMNNQNWVKLHDLPSKHIIASPE